MDKRYHQSFHRHGDRPRRTDLQPLVTNYHDYPDRRVFVSPVYRSSPVNTPDTAISLASPTLIPVRQYYRDHGMTTALQQTPVARQSSTIFPPNHPRRHSSISSTSGIATRLSRVAVASPSVPLQTAQTVQRQKFRSFAEGSRNQLLEGVNEDEFALLATVPRRRSSVQPNLAAQSQGKSPREYTLEILRQWGPAYLGNIGTADVMVRAVHLRPGKLTNSSLEDKDATPKQKDPERTPTPPSEDDASTSSSRTHINNDEIIIRARVIPNTKHRKPFIIQRKFDLAELRKEKQLSQPKSTDTDVTAAGDGPNNAPQKHTRSQSTPLPRPIAALPTPNPPTKPSLPRSSASSQERTMPIHREYALPHLPVLAALMLSGHIRKHDVIELPIPHPEVWAQTVAWVYTGNSGDEKSLIEENVRYLGGEA